MLLTLLGCRYYRRYRLSFCMQLWILALVTLEIFTLVIIFSIFFDQKLITDIQNGVYSQTPVIDEAPNNILTNITDLLENSAISKNSDPSDQTCSFPLEKMKPKSEEISDSTKFLIPILKWGPNNQMMGFFEALSVAKLTNRKLVLPPFYFHEKTQKHTKPFVPGELRVNVKAIPELVTLQDYKSVCGDKFDAIFLAIEKDVFSKTSKDRSGIMIQRVKQFQQITGIELLDKKTSELKQEIDRFPTTFTTDVRLNWRGYFRKAEDRKCAAFLLIEV